MADAVRSYERALAGFPTNTGVIGALAGYLERIGQTDRAAPILDPFGDGTAFGAPFGLMNYHLARGDLNRAAWARDPTQSATVFRRQAVPARPPRRAPYNPPSWP
jgi:hypothetical protein